MRSFRHGNLFSALVFGLAVSSAGGVAQNRRPLAPPPAPASSAPAGRTRLILKDGSYQLVLSYKVEGKIVRYRSAERDGAVEAIPLDMVDLPATEQWARDHAPGAADAGQAPVLSPELAREEADRAARTPEVAPDLRLPEEDSLLALDTFRGTPELVPLPQQGSDLNRETAHEVQKVEVNPASSPHRLGDIREERADVQLHVPDPVFYVRVGNEAADPDGGGQGMVVNTNGQSGRATPGTGSQNSGYVIERVDVRRGLREIDSFRLGQLGSGEKQRDVIETRLQTLPGGHWLKITPVEPLLFGEYALIEVLSDRAVNLDVWDFGVHPDAKENTEALRPEHRHAPSLERRH